MTDADRLLHMLDYARRAVRVLGELDVDALVADETRLLALERAVEVVGEAAARVSPAIQASHPEFAWRKMAGMRHVLAHGYAAIDHQTLHRVVRDELPPLIRSLERLLERDSP